MKRKKMLLNSIKEENIAKSTSKTKVIREDIISDTKSTVSYENSVVNNIIIAVAGASRGIGCTHAAISIANFIATLNEDVAIIEMNNNNHIAQIFNSGYDIKSGKLEKSFNLEGVDYYPNKSHSLAEILNVGYKYIIMDLSLIRNKGEKGAILNNENYLEMQRANKQILVSGIKDWQLEDLRIAIGGSDTDNWTLYLNFINDDMFDEFIDEVERDKVYKAPFNPDPFNITGELEESIKEILGDILFFKESKKNKGAFGIFKKR